LIVMYLPVPPGKYILLKNSVSSVPLW